MGYFLHTLFSFVLIRTLGGKYSYPALAKEAPETQRLKNLLRSCNQLETASGISSGLGLVTGLLNFLFNF